MKPVALTLGDPAGVGGEIALKAWWSLAGGLTFFLIGDHDHVATIAAAEGIPIRSIDNPDEAASATRHGLPVLHMPLSAPAPAGRPVAANAQSVIDSIVCGVRLVRSGAASSLCTNPINKKALMDGAGFRFPGHTEFLADLAGIARPVMMLVAPALRVVPVTIHIPLASVPGALTHHLLEETLRVTHRALATEFDIPRPRLAVAGLNPHAGEGGALGQEEARVIGPVLESLRQEGMDLSGPHSADTMFHAAARPSYDVAICMYHDQALIPLKTLDFDGGVNITLGLGFVRTSPDHGTAYDIAGSGTANPSSLIAALKMAADLAARRSAAE